MPPPEDESGELPQTNIDLKLEADELTHLTEQIQNEESYEEHEEDQFTSQECDYKNEGMEMDQYETEEHYQVQDVKNPDLMGTIIEEGSSQVSFETINNASFEESVPMETEVSEQSSHQETYFQLPCEKREVNENMLSEAHLITESDDAFETYESEILQQAGDEQSELKNNVTMEKNFYYEEPVEDEEDEEEEETIVQSEEYFQEEQPAEGENLTEENVFIESNYQTVEEYESSEQVIETTENEVVTTTELMNETADSVQSIISEEAISEDDSKSYTLKPKTVIAKGSVLRLNEPDITVKKIITDRSAQPSLKRPLLPGPGQSKNVITKVIIQGNPTSSSANPPYKIIGSAGSSIINSQTRSISLAQAQQMGLISPGAKIQQILPSTGSGNNQKRMIYKKIVPTCSSSLLSPSTTSKSPTKILPAPSPMKSSNIRPSVTTIRGPVSVTNIQTIRGNVPVTALKTLPSISNNSRPVPVAAITALRQSGLSNVNLKPVGTVKNLSGTQKVIFRQGQIPLKSGTIINPNNPGQVIRIPANASTLQPIQIGGGKQVQYVRFVSGTGNTIPTTGIHNAKSKIVKTPITQTYKAIPIAPNPNPTVKTVLPKPTVSIANTSGTAKRILIPVSQGVPQLCIANDVSNSGNESDGEKAPTVPVSALQQLKNTGSITAIPSSAVAQLRQGRNIATITNSQLAQIKSGQATSIQIKSSESGIVPVSAANSEGSFVVSEGSIVMLPPEMVQQINTPDSANGEAAATDSTEGNKSKPSSENEVNDEESCDKENIDSDGCRSNSPSRILEANGIRMKKPCNCTRSQCLKLYCECFANGEFCFQCNCNNCYNNIEHEEERQKSIKSCLERNPSAFRPKIQIGETEEDERRHNKGCHCKRSGCLKNYCECYEAKITCSKCCKCVGCRNTEEFLEGSRSGLIDLADAAEESFNSETLKPDFVLRPQSTNSNLKQPYNFMSSEVVEATCQCLLAQAEEAERNGLSIEEGEKLIIEEFGRCLVQIIGCSNVEENNTR